MQTGWYKLPAADKNPAEKLTENSGSENTDAENTETATGSNAEAAENNGSEETAASTASLPAISGYKYYDEDGKRASGWRTIEGVETSAKTASISASTLKTVLLTTEKKDLRSSPLSPKNTHLTLPVKCRPESSL